MKHYKTGDIVYWVRMNSNYKRYIDWGIVTEEFTDGVWVDKYCIKDHHTVDGVCITDMHFPTEWKQLPKNWSYDTQMYVSGSTFTEDEIEELKYLNTKDKDKIKVLIVKGLLIPASESMAYDYGHVEAEIEHGRYRLNYKHQQWSHKSTGGVFHWDELYESYDDAQAEIDRIKAENDRIAAMSDEEYQVWDLDDRLEKWRTPDMSDEYIQKIKDWLMASPEFYDFDFRGTTEGFQYKKSKNKKWLTVGITMEG